MCLCCPQFLITFYFIFCKYLCVNLLILNRKKKKLLEKDGSVSFHMRNKQILATKTFFHMFYSME